MTMGELCRTEALSNMAGSAHSQTVYDNLYIMVIVDLIIQRSVHKSTNRVMCNHPLLYNISTAKLTHSNVPRGYGIFLVQTCPKQ